MPVPSPQHVEDIQKPYQCHRCSFQAETYEEMSEHWNYWWTIARNVEQHNAEFFRKN